MVAAEARVAPAAVSGVAKDSAAAAAAKVAVDGAGGGGRGFNMAERLTSSLNLDENQRAQLEEIVAPQREAMRSFMEQRRELREAEQSGDEARATELRAALEQTGNPWESMGDVMDQVEPILNDEQYERFTEMRSRWEERAQSRDQQRRMMRDLPDELGLDDEQRQQFDDLRQSQRDVMRERMQEMRPKWEELREADEAGDTARADELRAELAEMRPGPESFREDFLDQVADFLHEDQLPKLAAFREQLASGGDAAKKDEIDEPDLRMIFQAIRRVRLESEQRDELKDIEREARKALRDIDRKDKAANADLVRATRTEIETLLTPAQKETFDQAMERLERRTKGRRERGRR